MLRIAVRLVHQAAIDLDELRMQLQDVRHARVAGPDVVDGEHGRRGGPQLEAAAQLLVVRDRLVLGDLDHPGRELAQHGVHPGVEEGAGREVHEQAHVARRRPAVADGLEAGQLELGADAQIRGVFEPLVRAAAAGDRRPGQHLVAQDGTVGQAHDRLGGHFDGAGPQKFLDQPRERFASDRESRIGARAGVVPHRVIHL